MATTTVEQVPSTPSRSHNEDHLFNDDSDQENRPYQHRFSRFDLEPLELASTASPTQAKRTIEAHLQETDRRLLDTQKLGNALLKQREDLTSRLEEVDQLQDDAQIPVDLRKRLADIDREHADVAREVARALIAPKPKQEDSQLSESSVFSTQASGSPTKISAPSRRHRNQPSTRAGDLQFAADISTSLLAQVRQLQAAVAERDIVLKRAQAERETTDNDVLAYTQKIRALDESEQRYKDENWNLETQNHELKIAAKELQDREKRLNAGLAATLAEKTKLQNDLDELILAHSKLSEEHVTARKAHDTEIHGLKRSADAADTERQLLQDRIDELVSQNQELAKTVSSRFRTTQADHERDAIPLHDETARAFDFSDDSPPPSPTKATPRPGGLESETLRSSLHHAHRMIQNLKGNIHREKTEKIELKRMLQDARDELEQKRGGDGSAAKRQKTKLEAFKKPARPEMLGGGRKARTDVELTDDDWEDHHADTQLNTRSANLLLPAEQSHQRLTDASDAYHTADDTDGMFDTADERNTTESEAFMTGAESLAGDSSDELTETEDTASRTQSHRPARVARNLRAGDTVGGWPVIGGVATTSADELEDLRTPVQPSFTKFRPRDRTSQGKQMSLLSDNTPESFRAHSVSQDSPATVMTGQSPHVGEQTLFSELEDMGEVHSDTHSTPARSTLSSQHSTPGVLATPSRSTMAAPPTLPRPAMVDSSMMTDTWLPDKASATHGLHTDHAMLIENHATDDVESQRALLPAADMPLPPSVPVSPIRKMDNGTQYTPQRGTADSPVRPGSSYITPPKTVWDEVHEPVTPTPVLLNQPEIRQPPLLNFSSVLSNDSEPVADVPYTPKSPTPKLSFSSISSHEVEPVIPSHAPGVTSIHSAVTSMPERPRTPNQAVEEENKNNTGAILGGGLLASAATALGLTAAKHTADSQPVEDTTHPIEPPRSIVDTATSPIKDVAGDSRRITIENFNADPFTDKLRITASTDQASQTLLTAEQLDEALRRQNSAPQTLPISEADTNSVNRTTNSPSRFSSRPNSRTRGIAIIEEDSSLAGPSSVPPRPGSASSNRPSSHVPQQHPPLPSDHKDIIAKANNQAGSPIKRDSSIIKAGGIMGPPILPASAMRRPRTPNGSVRSATKGGATGKRDTFGSQISRRSSVSSFASELDERFNIRPDMPTGMSSYESGLDTDPRMIQAITQTMIGEFLWKYTRKAGSKGMSSTRHRRYFWVHPYTKTLYWSDQDPQTAGRNELKAKSVAILSVRVVSDDNPMPPGLHRKSLEVTTPGRVVKFTASTGQRHETWFNALSYLLYRGERDDSKNKYAPNGTEITKDDLTEFSLGGYGARLVPNDGRMSMSSYNSRTTRNTSKNRANRQSLTGGVGSMSSQNPPAEGIQTLDNNDTIRRSRVDQAQVSDNGHNERSSSVVRISKMIGSVTGRTKSENRAGPSQKRENSSIYDASIVSQDHKDEGEEAAKRAKQAESSAGLEDVRACCDGKHNVSSLTHHPSTTSNTHNRVSDVVNRSMSRRF